MSILLSRRQWIGGVVVLTLIASTAAVTAMLPGTGEPAVAVSITATCTNSIGDAARIQTAINRSSVGDEIVIDGPCLIAKTIILLGNRGYRGDSAQTTLTEASGSNLAGILVSDSWANNSKTTGDPITLRDLTIDANKVGNPTAGDAIIIRSWNTVIDNLKIRNAKANGLRVTDKSSNGTILTNTQVNGNIRGLFVTDSGKSGIYVEDSGNAVTDWNLADSWVAKSGGDAICLEDAAGWTVERNHVYGVGGSGINADRLFGTSLSDNYIEDFATKGIAVTVQGDAASTIIGNRIFQFKGVGSTFLAIEQVNYGMGQVAVTGNVIRGSGTGTGMSYQRGSNQLAVTSSGNSVAGVTTMRTIGAGVTVSGGL
jgi:hypothetical protein